LSLVISQTQEVHEQIADLLEQMRRLLDVQITVEARFLAVPENFFERLGADFDLAGAALHPNMSTEVGEDGLERIGIDFDDLDHNIWREAESDAGPLAQTNHAVLSDAQARLLMQVVQGDRSAGIIAAPKVTMFNGQRVYMSFVHAAEGEKLRSFAAKALRRRQEETVSLTENGEIVAAYVGPRPARQLQTVSLALQGVVSSDRRSVRLSVAPRVTALPHPATTAAVFPQSTADAAPQEPAPDETVAQGPTVTMAVPDGRAVLVDGGELPTAKAGRKSAPQRLLLLVTPRILIAEEEEAKLGVQADVDAPSRARR
jgi:general secretion pathway protein D